MFLSLWCKEMSNSLGKEVCVSKLFFGVCRYAMIWSAVE